MSLENDTKGAALFFPRMFYLNSSVSAESVFHHSEWLHNTFNTKVFFSILSHNITFKLLHFDNFDNDPNSHSLYLSWWKKKISTRVYENYKSPAKAAVESGSD